MPYYAHDLFQDVEGTRLQSHVGAGAEETGTTWEHLAGVGSTYLAIAAPPGGVRLEAVSPTDMLIGCYRISNLSLPVDQYSVSFVASFIGQGGRLRVHHETATGMTAGDVDALSPLVLVAPDGTVYVGPEMLFSAEITDTGTQFTVRVDVNGHLITVYVNNIPVSTYDYGQADGNPVLYDESDNVIGPNPDYRPRNYRPISKNFAIFLSVDPGYPVSSVTLHSFSIGEPGPLSDFWTEQVGVSET